MIIAAAAAWGVIGLFINALRAEGFTLTQIIASTALVTAAAMAVITAVTDKSNFRINPRDFWMFAGTGIASYTFESYSYYTAIGRIGLGPAAVLLYTSPFFIMLLSRIIWKEKLTARKLTAVPLAVAGCVCVSVAPAIAEGRIGAFLRQSRPCRNRHRAVLRIYFRALHHFRQGRPRKIQRNYRHSLELYLRFGRYGSRRRYPRGLAGAEFQKSRAAYLDGACFRRFCLRPLHPRSRRRQPDARLGSPRLNGCAAVCGILFNEEPLAAAR